MSSASREGLHSMVEPVCNIDLEEEAGAFMWSNSYCFPDAERGRRSSSRHGCHKSTARTGWRHSAV